MENRIVTYPNLDLESTNKKILLIQPTFSSIIQVFDFLQKNQDGIDLYLWENDNTQGYKEWTDALLPSVSLILMDQNIWFDNLNENLKNVLRNDNLVKYTNTRELLTYLQ